MKAYIVTLTARSFSNRTRIYLHHTPENDELIQDLVKMNMKEYDINIQLLDKKKAKAICNSRSSAEMDQARNFIDHTYTFR